MDRSQQVLDKLSAIIDPDLGKDIVSLGFIKELGIDDNGAVRFAIELTTPACPVKEKFRADAERLVRELAWVTAVDVTMTAQARRGSPLGRAGNGLQGVKHIVAVASCKGGVGKSTVAVNLAFTLQRLGARVGIFDADIYGPSLPTMVATDFEALYQHNNLILPVKRGEMPLMSFGFANAATGGGPAVMRGPMVTQVVNQLLTGTDWGLLDYLVLDLPPGTGDIQLTLSQIIPITAAVMVTTPQEISFVDVVKGLQMFDKLKIPTIAVVENMSYFICPNCDEKHYLFGRGAMRKLVEQYGLQNSFEVPMDARIAAQGDAGTPIVEHDPDGAIAVRYRELAQAVVREVAKVAHGGMTIPEVVYEAGKGIRYKAPGGEDQYVTARALRLACRCAACISEYTGEQLLDPATVPADVRPDKLSHLGNYAVTIAWSDGHNAIYPYDALAKLAL